MLGLDLGVVELVTFKLFEKLVEFFGVGDLLIPVPVSLKLPLPELFLELADLCEEVYNVCTHICVSAVVPSDHLELILVLGQQFLLLALTLLVNGLKMAHLSLNAAYLLLLVLHHELQLTVDGFERANP